MYSTVCMILEYYREGPLPATRVLSSHTNATPICPTVHAPEYVRCRLLCLHCIAVRTAVSNASRRGGDATLTHQRCSRGGGSEQLHCDGEDDVFDAADIAACCGGGSTADGSHGPERPEAATVGVGTVSGLAVMEQ